MHSRRLSFVFDEDQEDTGLHYLSKKFDGRSWKPAGRSLNFSTCVLASNSVTSPLKFGRKSSASVHKEDSPLGWQSSTKGRAPRSWWLKAAPFNDGTPWRVKCKEQVSEIGVGEIEHSQESFLLLQAECAKLKQEREKLLTRLQENEIECEMYTSQLTIMLENNNSQLRQASESVRKMESVISYLESVILSKDLEIQLLKRSSDATSCCSSLSVAPPSSESNEDETELMLSSRE
eukprot:g2304.t1